MSAIKVEKIKKAYVNRRTLARNENDAVPRGENINVLDGIDLAIEEGEMVCILGPSGCGKSTLLRIIAGFDRASEGQVTIDNEVVTGSNQEHIFVFQQNGLFPWMTVWENVKLGLRNIEDSEEMNEKIQEYVDMVELNGFEHHHPNQLSGGMQRRAELARALAVNPDVLYLDEPFTGLDFMTHMKVREEVVNLHSFLGKTMVMVTHFIDDALIMADRIVVLSDRPSKVMFERKLDFARPRNLEKDPDLAALRDEIFMMLGVSYVA